MPWYAGLIIGIVVGVIAGGIAGVYFSQKMFKKQLKNNPPINEKMIRMLYSQVGRKPSEAQVRQILEQMTKSIK